MLHRRGPVTCWCGQTHSRGETFDLNVRGQYSPPDPADVQLEEARRAAESRQRCEDIAEAGGWNLLTNDEVDQHLRDHPLTDEEIAELHSERGGQ